MGKLRMREVKSGFSHIYTYIWGSGAHGVD